jgi:hypothetical protein
MSKSGWSSPKDATNSGLSPLTSHEMDQQVMQNFLRRMARIAAEVKSVNPETEGKKLCEKLYLRVASIARGPTSEYTCDRGHRYVQVLSCN